MVMIISPVGVCNLTERYGALEPLDGAKSLDHVPAVQLQYSGNYIHKCFEQALYTAKHSVRQMHKHSQMLI